MSDVDVAAIRARCATSPEDTQRWIQQHTAIRAEHIDAWIDGWTRVHQVALTPDAVDGLRKLMLDQEGSLAECSIVIGDHQAADEAVDAALATRDARIAELETQLAEADDATQEALAHNDNTCEAVAERDRARAALQITLDSARIDRAAAVSTDRLALLRAAIEQLRLVRVDCTALTGPVWYGDGWAGAIRELEEIADRWPDPEPDAHPPVDEYRVEVRLQCELVPWVAFTSPTDADGAVKRMHLAAEDAPDWDFRVVHTRATSRVVTTLRAEKPGSESAPPADGPGPHATENGPGRAPDGPAAPEGPAQPTEP